MQGKYSENDTTNWTPELRRALNYDQTQARQVDNGEVERDLTSESEVERDLTPQSLNFVPRCFLDRLEVSADIL